MFSFLDSARNLETWYKLCNPATMGDDPEYTAYRTVEAMASVVQNMVMVVVAVQETDMIVAYVDEVF